MNPDVIESINLMTAKGNRLELPAAQITNYPAVKKALQQAGGKYSKNGFTFTTDAAEMQARLVGGESVNDKKKFQFFATPEDLASNLVIMAGIQPGNNVLEPSAGQGAIADIIRQYDCKLTLVELMPDNVKVLQGKGYAPDTGDFLEVDKKDYDLFDRIVANPPFTKNQDIDHIKHMYSLLGHGGKLVSIASTSWQNNAKNKAVEFKEWLSGVDATVHQLPPGTFKESGTNVAATIIEIIK